MLRSSDISIGDAAETTTTVFSKARIGLGLRRYGPRSSGKRSTRGSRSSCTEPPRRRSRPQQLSRNAWRVDATNAETIAITLAWRESAVTRTLRFAFGRARAVPQTRTGVTPLTPIKSENANGPTLECDEKWLLDHLEHLQPVCRAKDTILATADGQQQMTILQENDPVLLDQTKKFVMDFLKNLGQHPLP